MSLAHATRAAWEKVARNKAVKWALGYCFVAYATLGVSLALRETFGWSGLVPRFTAYVLLVGFVVLLPIYWRERSSRWEFAIAVALALLGGTALWKAWRQYSWREVMMTPNVALRFVNPTEPDLAVENLSGAVVREIIWVPALWDVDSPERSPGTIQPLKVASVTVGWLQPHQTGGPQQLFTPEVASELKRGDRIYGSVSVSCPLCPQGHTYILALRWREGGWYYEVPGVTDARAFVPVTATHEGLARFAQGIEADVPFSARIPIKRLKFRPTDLKAQQRAP